MRLDQWLWAVRIFKSRSLAADTIRAGRALVHGHGSKPAHEVKAGEIITVRIAWDRERTLRVLGVPASRIAAKRVAEFAEELPGEISAGFPGENDDREQAPSRKFF